MATLSLITTSDNQVVESLLKVVLLCGKQGLALCGHHDNNVLWTENEEGNQGNFIEFVRFRAETDEILRQHLQKAPGNALYTSKTIQNEMIEVIGKHIQNKIMTKSQRS